MTKRNIQVYMIILFFVGLLYSFFIPTWQTPDEQTHLNLIGNSLGYSELGNIVYNSETMDLMRIVRNPNEKLTFERMRAGFKSSFKELNLERSGNVGISVVKHLPSAIVIQIGIWVGGSVVAVLLCAEIASLLFSLCICYIAFCILPVKKEAFMLICATPMWMQQMSSINYDVMVLPFCMLFVAYISNLKHKDKDIQIGEIVFALLILAVAAYVKPPYIMLALLIFTLPLDKIYINSKWKRLRLFNKRIIIILATIVIAVAAMMVINRIQLTGALRGFQGAIGHIRTSYNLIRRTYFAQSGYWKESMVDYLGWFDTQMPMVFTNFIWIVLILSALVLNTDGMAKGFKLSANKVAMYLWDRVVYLVIIIFLGSMIILSMFDFTMTQTLENYSEIKNTYDFKQIADNMSIVIGVQGRYFIPLIPVFLLFIPEIIPLKYKYRKWIVYIGAAVISAISLYFVKTRYWV